MSKYTGSLRYSIPWLDVIDYTCHYLLSKKNMIHFYWPIRKRKHLSDITPVG